GRAQAKTTARIEALESKLEGGFSDLRSELGTSGRGTAGPDLEEVLDALDILDEASRTLEDGGNAPAAEGLRGVADRLQRFLARAGLTRIAKPPSVLDGRIFRVVGVVERHDLADGTPAQVVRAAALAGDRLIREGEVLVNRRS
ncbi:MAG TPA: nucleotide exchange factor GrpE, partial [Anaeromyxobacteraceae bacterium]|nr:nucleotide exchange factor GrpE [Anaeromyxobacteraceae bacterium]